MADLPAYRLSRPEELNAQAPLCRDRRPRLALPLVTELPAFGDDAAWAGRPPSTPFVYPFEIARTTCTTRGTDLWRLHEDPLAGAPGPALNTQAQGVARQATSRSVVLHLRFVCCDPAMSRATAEAAQPDYVSLLLNLDRRRDRVIEVGLHIDGSLWTREYRQFAGIHSCTSMLHPGPVVPLPASDRSVQGVVRCRDDRWLAELRVSLNYFGQYGEPFVVYPANMFRFYPPCPLGAPSGIAWRAAVSGFSWAPVRFLVDEFDRAGAIVAGDLADGLWQQQQAEIDAAANAAAMSRRIDLVARRKAAADGWRAELQPSQLPTQWLPKAIPGYAFVDRGFTLNNSRQLVSDDDGTLWVLAEDSDCLSIVRASVALDPVDNALPNEAVTLIADLDELSHASLCRGPDGVLHVVFAAAGACWHASSSDDWQRQPLPVVGDSKPYDLACVGDRLMVVLAASDERMWLASWCAETGWDPPRDLPFTGRCPVLAEAAAGGLHLAYERNATIYYVRMDATLRCQAEPVVAAYAVVFYPAIIEVDDRPLIVYQFLGVQKAVADPDLYIAERERCGAGIGVARLGCDRRWRHQFVARAEEQAVRRLDSKQYMLDMVNRPHRGRVYLLPDENWRPSIGKDANGVVRAAWQNTTRTHAFVAQWTGDAFAAPQVLAGPLPSPTPHIGLEKHSAQSAVLSTVFVAENRLLLDAQPSADWLLERAGEVCLLDDSLVQSRSGLSWHAAAFERHPENPLLELPGSGRGHGRDGLSRPNVIVPADGNGLLMMCANHAGGGGHVYAASDDGVDWHFLDEPAFAGRLPAHLRAVVGQEGEEQYLAPGYTFTSAWRGLEDLLECDPQRRFKKLIVEGKTTDTEAVRRVWYSPDGVAWTPGPEARNNVHLNETHVPNLYDPWDIPERRFKIYGRTTTEQGRSLALQWSADMVDWHGDVEPVVREDPWSRPGASRATAVREAWCLLEGSAADEESEHYYCTPWLEAGYYFLLYGSLQWDGHKPLRLAYSRDGFHFRRLGGDCVLPPGPPGAFDSGSIDSPCFVERGDELWMYYSGTGEKHGSLPYTAQHCIGLARLRRRSWGCFRLAPGVATGELTTVPISAAERAGRALALNCAGPGDGIVVELLDAATGEAIENFAAADCDPVGSGLTAKVSWRGRSLTTCDAARLQFRCSLRSAQARLYGFTLA